MGKRARKRRNVKPDGDTSREEVYGSVERDLDNCSYLDDRTVDAAFGALIDWCRDHGIDDAEVEAIVALRLANEPYPERDDEGEV